MRPLHMITRDNPPSMGQALKDLSNRPGSPCIDCLVDSACRKSFVDRSACDKFAIFIQTIMIKAGMKLDENKK